MADSLRAAVTGVGSYVPARTMTNADFEKILDTTDEWITQRTGIKERRIRTDGESTLTMATEASRQALAEANVDAAELDLTTVAQPAFETGKKAAEILINRIEQREDRNGCVERFQQVVLPAKLIVRGSCGAQRPTR